jgi:hypothetical protein
VIVEENIMAAKILTPAETTELLQKARKGTDAAFGVAQWAAVFNALGWATEIVKERNSIVEFNVTTSAGQKLAMRKENGYRVFTFYHGTIDGVEWDAFLRPTLLNKTPFLADIEKVIGPEPKKEEFRRPGAPTCPVCFRDILLDDAKKMVHHGYERPGHGYIVGDCFGVGYEPLEVSKKGSEAYLAKILRPHLAGRKLHLAELKSGEITQFVELPRPRHNGQGPKEEPKIITKLDQPEEFARRMERAIAATEHQIALVKADIATFEKVIPEWQPKPLPEFIGNIPTMHWTVTSRRWGETASCVAYGMRPKYVRHTKVKADVTCKRCLKDITQAAEREAKKAAGSSTTVAE